VLSKITTWLAVIFIGLAIFISILSGPTTESSSSLVKKASENNPVQQQPQSVLPDQEESVLDLGE
jgi:preprotein translocase subunit SecG